MPLAETVPQGVKAVVFDLGNVLVQWDPRHFYRGFFNDDVEMELFVQALWDSGFITMMDRGALFAEALDHVAPRYRKWERALAAYGPHYLDSFQGPIASSVEVLKELRANKVPVYALSNWTAEFFPAAVEAFPFLDWFDGRIVSGFEKCIKPEPQIYRLLFERYNLDPAQALFVDDRPENIATAQALGMQGLVFQDDGSLRRICEACGLLSRKTVPQEGKTTHD